MTQIKILKDVYNNIVSDLERLHTFAYERVGFLYINVGRHNNNIEQIISTKYCPVPDDNYIIDPKVGARINTTAIRTVMQRVLDTGEGVLHVHMHENIGTPRFSKTDRHSLLELIPSFQSCNSQTVHGALLLSKNSATALIWLPNEKSPVIVNNITIVGSPIVSWGRY